MVKAPGSREDGSEDENTWSGRGVVNADDGSGDVESVKKVAQGSKKPSSAFSSLDVPEDARRMWRAEREGEMMVPSPPDCVARPPDVVWCRTAGASSEACGAPRQRPSGVG